MVQLKPMDCTIEGISIRSPEGVVRLADVTVVAPAGQLTAVFGAAGSGRSELLRALAGDLPAGYQVTGSVSLGGEALLGQPSVRLIRQGIRYLGTQRPILPRLSVRKNLGTPARLVGTSEKAIAAWLEKLMDYFPRLNQRLDQIAANLSLGEQQILAVANAVAAKPRLLALDSASSGISELGLRELFDGLRRYAREQHTIVICGEENAPALVREADQILVLRRGRLFFSGSREEFRADPWAPAALGLTRSRPHYRRRLPS